MIQILKDTVKNKEQLDMLETIQVSSDNLLRIINDILDLSKIEAGKIEFEKTNFNLNDQLNSCINLFIQEANQKGISLKYQSNTESKVDVLADVTRIHQIITNLLSNAIKFTDAGDVVLELSANESQNSSYDIEISVKDSGIGISSQQMNSLFDSFRQADNSITRRYGGTGLGLSICSKLAQMMGGEILVSSELGKGSTFTLRLNLQKSDRIEISEEKANKSFEELASAYPHQILVVEDNLMNQKIITMMLKKLGYDCDIAQNGQEALDMLNEHNNKYSLIFMDMQMPVMDGIEATKKLNKLYQDQLCPIIAMTANVLAADKEKCFNAGMKDFIGKPIQIEEIKRVLKTYHQKLAA